MLTKNSKTRLTAIILTIIVLAIMLAAGLYRIEIDNDILSSLPQSDPVIKDAGYIFLNHPVQDQVVIDISHQKDDIDLLVDGGKLAEKAMNSSGLFKSVGMKDMQQIFPELITHVTDNLPLMFTKEELDSQIKPLLRPDKIRNSLNQIFDDLMNLDGIGQSDFIAGDPLGFRNIILAKIAHLAPSNNIQIYREQIISSDSRHLLLIATSKTSGTDTVFSRKMTALAEKISEMLKNKYSDKGYEFTLTPVGSYRAALDNELTARADTERAILFATLGIALLLILAFPRPIIGLLAFLPAFAGMIASFFVYSLIYKSISILTIGFGGAIISITIDHGIAYLLILDRPHETKGREAAREVWAVGLLATLTTVGAFSSLFISGFPTLTQIGQFAAMGIAFSFMFVHTAFPHIFPVMPAAKKKRSLPLQSVVNAISLKGGKYKAFAALALAIVMLFFAKPEFQVDLSSMNSVTSETIAAEKIVSETWGNIFNKIYILTEGASLDGLREKGDMLATEFRMDKSDGVLESAFTPSMIFPGKSRAEVNFRAWKSFWNGKRISALKKNIEKASSDLGFSRDAFKRLYSSIQAKKYTSHEIPERFFSTIGISTSRTSGKWLLFSTLTPGKKYNPEKFYSKYSSIKNVKVLDPKFFSDRLGKLLSSTFLKMAMIIGISVTILLFIFYVDWKLTLISLLPIAFALPCTLGTMKLIGHPLDIPALMLSIIIIGMGIDYSLFLVRSYQRYREENHKSLGLIRMAVFLASLSTIIGFGVLNFADHTLLKSAGLTCLLGISYSLAGAFIILPPLLKRTFSQKQMEKYMKKHAGNHKACALTRYRHMEARPRLFARFKMKFDPMFSELHTYLKNPKKIIDIGTGYGIPAAWLLEMFPKSRIFGLEPDSERLRVSSTIIGNRGTVEKGSAPDLPQMDGKADAVLMIDMAHYLSDDNLLLALSRISKKIKRGGETYNQNNYSFR